MTRTAVAVALAVLSGLGPCRLELPVSTFDYEALRLTFIPAADGSAVQFVEVYRGIHSEGDPAAAQSLSELVRRRRVYPPEGGLLSLDLDGPMADRPSDEPPDP